MGLNDVVSSERVHISFFGKRNAGKSSVINSVTGQNLSIVSDTLGTTTDPVLKSMELLPIGPVVIIDTPGIDDVGELGKKRVEKAMNILNKTDIAILVIDSAIGKSKQDDEIISLIKEKKLPYIICYNKSDLKKKKNLLPNEIAVNTVNNENIYELKQLIGSLVKVEEKYIVRDYIKKGDIVILVIPIDAAAPKGRIIFPQQQVLREVLDCSATAICVQPSQLSDLLLSLNHNPSLVITDSQAFKEVSEIVPKEISLTSFSILFMKYKGELDTLCEGVNSFDTLSDGDTVLISEGCTHHRQCNDIGTVKLPKLIIKKTGKKINFETTSGIEFPKDLKKYKMIIHCGGCMLNEKEMKYRIGIAKEAGVSITNYGVTFAYFNGILKRSTEILCN